MNTGNNKEELEITFKMQKPNKRIPLYKLTDEELLQKFENSLVTCHLNAREIGDINTILNPLRDEIMRRMECK